MNKQHTAVGMGGLVLSFILMIGAVHIDGNAGYAGIGPNFLPWLVAGVFGFCSAVLVWEGLRGGFSNFEPSDDAATGDWYGFAWVSAGLLLNAALITTIGFVLSCSLLFMLAVHGFRNQKGWPKPLGLMRDAVIGALISGPVFWLFGMLLGINLPSLTGTPWL